MRRVLDVMTTEVICASRDTPYKQLVRLLLARKVEVRDGVVALRGEVERSSTIPLLVRAVYGVDGVVRVDDQLSYRVDDIPWFVPLWAGGARTLVRE